MVSKVFKDIFLFVGTLIVSVLFFGGVVFAEGDIACSGKVSGETVLSNSNAGQINFNSHPQVDGSALTVDLSIVGMGTGVAPAEREHASCVSTKEGAYGGQNYEYELQGYAWNTNLGFFSFYCGAGGKNPETDHDPNNAVSPINCGGQQYGVKIGPVVGGFRPLFGYAWNPVFGYIQFQGSGISQDAIPFDYGVVMNANGDLSGFAWSQAGVYLNFSGARIQLPDFEEPVEMAGNTWCRQGVKPCGCVEVSQADNKDYYLHVYLRSCTGNDPDGNGDGVQDFRDPLPLDDYDLSLSFDWKDTVKLNQLAGSFVRDSLNSVESPWNGGDGGVVYKPVEIANTQGFLDDFEAVNGDLGHYISKQRIMSYAPTSNENISFTTGSLPPIPFPNELFVDDLSYDGEVWSHNMESNDLVLKNITYTITDKDLLDNDPDRVKTGVVYPNGRDGWFFKFEPVIEFKDFYAADKDDEIVHFRNVPVAFTVSLKPIDLFTIGSAAVYLVLDYDKIATRVQNQGNDYVNFDFHFVNNANGSPKSLSYNDGSWTFGELSPDDNTYSVLRFATQQLLNRGINLSAVATLPQYDVDVAAAVEVGEEILTLPPDNMAGPTLYSIITYEVEHDNATKIIKYYGNKLPRTLSEAVNPAVVVHGNVYAKDVFSPTASHKIQRTGNVAIDAVRNTINENVKKQFRDEQIDATFGSCMITNLVDGEIVIEGCRNNYKQLQIGDENVLFFRNKDIVLDLNNNDNNSSISGNWAIIVDSGEDGGNLFINNDIYLAGSTANLAIAVMNSYSSNDFRNGACSNGNVYIHPDVKNIQANIVSDCSIFSYDPDQDIASDGIPSFTYETFVNVLNKQLYWQGSVASRNTIGGADLDAVGKQYLLLGTGKTVQPHDPDGRLKAQLYDLNYLRLFKLSVAVNEAGLPIDQQCGEALTVEQSSQINQWLAGGEVDPVYGEKTYDDGSLIECDGIDLYAYNNATGLGDLVPPAADSGVLALGLPEGSYDPVRIDYVESDSFLFKKAEEKSSN